MLQLVVNLRDGEAELACREVQGDVGEGRDGGANGRGEHMKAFLRRMVLHIEVNSVYRLERMEREEERTMEHNCRRLSCFSWSGCFEESILLFGH
jgi:hypothetical protein